MPLYIAGLWYMKTSAGRSLFAPKRPRLMGSSLTFFSTPYYSSLSLLPNDPLPFTVPSASSKRSRNPNVSLNDYPLPDGTWRWMSKAWMIDMRTDLGEVQHDGFEYNWSFREKNWRAKIGSLSMGAWVRRRRWVRLMMRPAKWTSDHLDIVASSTEDPLTTLPSTSSFLLVHPDSDVERDEPSKLWMGDPDSDWDRCRRLLKRVGSDGRKLELWRLWLDLDNLDKARDEKGKVRRQGEDYQPSGPTWKHGEHSPPLPYLKSMLQNHVRLGRLSSTTSFLRLFGLFRRMLSSEHSSFQNHAHSFSSC